MILEKQSDVSATELEEQIALDVQMFKPMPFKMTNDLIRRKREEEIRIKYCVAKAKKSEIE